MHFLQDRGTGTAGNGADQSTPFWIYREVRLGTHHDAWNQPVQVFEAVQDGMDINLRPMIAHYNQVEEVLLQQKVRLTWIPGCGGIKACLFQQLFERDQSGRIEIQNQDTPG